MATTAGRQPAVRVGQVPAWLFAVRQLRFWLTDYRRTWRGSIYTSLLGPLLYLGAMGLGLGTLVDRHGSAALGGVRYVVFLAPGLLAATGMQTAIHECSFPVFGCVKWNKTYQAAVASPVRPADVFHGHLLFLLIRLTMNSAIFLAVAAALGAVTTGWLVLALPVSVLTGVAFGTLVEAWAVTRDRDTSFALIFRFVMIPLMLFSGTFFPVTQLPGWVRPLAYITPLWHGVTLSRQLSLGTVTAGGALVHIGYLVALTVAGILIGNRTYRWRLYV